MSGALGSRRNPVVCYTCVETRVSVRQVLDLQVPVRHQFDPVAIRANADAVFCPCDRGGGGRLWLTHDDYLAIQGTHHVRLYRVFLESRRKIYIKRKLHLLYLIVLVPWTRIIKNTVIMKPIMHV